MTFRPCGCVRVTRPQRCANCQVIARPRSAPTLLERNVLSMPCWYQPASSSDSSQRHCAQIIQSHQSRVVDCLREHSLGRLTGTKLASDRCVLRVLEWAYAQASSWTVQRWSEMRLSPRGETRAKTRHRLTSASLLVRDWMGYVRSGLTVAILTCSGMPVAGCENS